MESLMFQAPVLRTLTPGRCLTQDLANTTLSGGLQTLTFGWCLSQDFANSTLSSGLQTLTFGCCLSQDLANSPLHSGLQTLTFGWCLSQDLANATLHCGLRTLTPGRFTTRSTRLPCYTQEACAVQCIDSSAVHYTEDEQRSHYSLHAFAR